MARRRKIVGLGEAMEGVLRRADPRGKRHGARAVAAWHEVVGEEISRHTHGFAVRENGELVVFVDSAAWATQLSLMAPDLIERINSYVGEKTVRALRFTVSRNVADEVRWTARTGAEDEFYASDTTVPVPLSEREREQAAHIALAVRDPELHDIALRVMIKDLELKKGERESAGKSGCQPDSESP